MARVTRTGQDMRRATDLVRAGHYNLARMIFLSLKEGIKIDFKEGARYIADAKWGALAELHRTLTVERSTVGFEKATISNASTGHMDATRRYSCTRPFSRRWIKPASTSRPSHRQIVTPTEGFSARSLFSTSA